MPRGRPPKSESSKNNNTIKIKCLNCDSEYVEANYYKTKSLFFKQQGRLPYCKKCVGEYYQYYVEKYKLENYAFPEKRAIQRICMAFDIYYSNDVFDSAIKMVNDKPAMSVISAYMKIVQLTQNKDKTYDTTIRREDRIDDESEYIASNKDMDVDEETIRFFGGGFSEADYKFLREQYDDWTARHECETKAQEEIFKRICFKQLEILKATRLGEDTKNLDATFQNLLDTAKLQPKQNSGDSASDSQTFGTLIDKWENTRPIPEIDEELRDVDKIGLYIDTFFRGHLAKMMGLKNGLSRLYNNFMKKYTVDIPEYDEDTDNEVLFDAIFGDKTLESDDEQGGD